MGLAGWHLVGEAGADILINRRWSQRGRLALTIYGYGYATEGSLLKQCEVRRTPKGVACAVQDALLTYEPISMRYTLFNREEYMLGTA